MVSTWALVLIFTFTRYCPRPHWSTLVSDMVVGKLFWLMFFAVSFFHVRNAPVCLANHSFILYSPIFFGSLFSVPVYLTAYLQLRYCLSVCLSPSLPFSSLLLPPATRLCRTSLRRRGPPREERHTQTPHPFEGTTPSIYTAVHRSRFSPAFFLSVPGPALSPRLFSFSISVAPFGPVQLCESRGGRPGLPVLISLMVSVDVKQHWTMHTHWSQFVPNMSTDIRVH